MNKKGVVLLSGIVACVTVAVTLGNVVTAQAKDPKDIATVRLEKFDELDYEAFSKQNWDLFHKTHTDDVVVVWPDGHETRGFDKHIEDMKYMFSYAPDTKITAHPVKVASGDWTAVIGEMSGTFSKPMVTADGKTIQPTGKKFKLQMATFAHWKGDKFDKEILIWDNQTFMKQIGLAP
jgi:SnoaL-like polyketide cyclase